MRSFIPQSHLCDHMLDFKLILFLRAMVVNKFCMWEDHRGVRTFEKLWFIKSLILPSLESNLILFFSSMDLTGRLVSEEPDEQNIIMMTEYDFWHEDMKDTTTCSTTGTAYPRKTKCHTTGTFKKLYRDTYVGRS